MKRFPRAAVEVQYQFVAKHAVPESAHKDSKELHEHTYWVAIGYHHERNGPFTWDRVELHQKFMPLIEELNGSNLNIICGESASDEVLASWMLSRLPGWVDYVQIDRLTPEEQGIRAITKVARRDLT